MTSYRIKSDATGDVFECDSGDTVLRSALRAGVNFSYECNSGGCGACKFEAIEGTFTTLWPDAPGLSRRDIRKGRMLGCQCVPDGDAVIRFNPDPEAEPDRVARPQRGSLTLREVNMLTADMAEFVFEGDGAERFLPGQIAMFDLPGITGARAYSMSNLPNDSRQWRFIIKHVPGGAGTGYLFDTLQLGDVLPIDAPYGKSYFRPENGRDIVCIAGGSGLSPVMSIARAATRDPAMAGRRVLMFYGGRSPEDICTPGLVSELNGPGAEITCFNAISDETRAGEWDGDCCFIHELAERTLGDEMAAYDYYFCGPPPMTDAVQRMLMIEHKVLFDQLYFDRFF
ncbi:2Fe-2S iron-sulfur cluster-binding protein [Profundibacter sp.]|uniref:2Fe-2S iron-sulfur cluster-binding protein n=1 Tax=Profundibacter sp. TaxID=3101071 RepID=UPI003D12EF4C